jgi:hypothetical protein
VGTTDDCTKSSSSVLLSSQVMHDSSESFNLRPSLSQITLPPHPGTIVRSSSFRDCRFNVPRIGRHCSKADFLCRHHRPCVGGAMIGNQRGETTDSLRLPASRTSRTRSPGGWEAEVVFWGFYLVVSHDPTDAGSVVIAGGRFNSGVRKIEKNPILIRKMNKLTVPSRGFFLICFHPPKWAR